jgi:hypothetical protein
MSEEAGDEGILERPEDDDHDLLTYGEAGARITEELAAEKDRLRDWEARLAAGEDVSPQLAKSQHRLGLLRDAARRNARQPITDDNFEHFFGYQGKAKRNT